MAVSELRLVVTAPDYDHALAFYRDVLGLEERAAFSSSGGRVTILDAGRATLELADPPHAAFIDRWRWAGGLRARSGSPSGSTTSRVATAELAGAGATVVAEPVETPWRSRNARLAAPAGLQLTLFQELDA
ncbi:MAG TPA: VOC family protein [Aquihabitans sp.]|jgi:predicted enzyme related to lactoylglutathione lyase|nr:VOC family protein [Aquihabitans sp.]